MAVCSPSTVNPLISRATIQKNIPLRTIENNPRVTIVIGRVKIETIGFIIMLINTKHAPTITAVSIEFTPIPDTKDGRANMASVVINQRSSIIQFFLSP